MTQNILTEIDQGVAILTLNRADRHNAFDDITVSEIAMAMSGFNADESVRAIVLSSTGKSFCAGADLNWMKRMAGYSTEENLKDSTAMAEMFRAIAQSPKPVLARVQGAAYGGGVGLVAACDIAVATIDAEFALTEAKLGLIPAVISPHVVAAIGERSARRYFLTAERFSVAEAYRMGLLHEMVVDEEIRVLNPSRGLLRVDHNTRHRVHEPRYCIWRVHEACYWRICEVNGCSRPVRSANVKSRSLAC